VVASGAIAEVLTDANVTACFDVPISITGREGRWQAQAS
jgi:hypothetical protein